MCITIWMNAIITYIILTIPHINIQINPDINPGTK